MSEQHYIPSKIFINDELQSHKYIEDMADELLKMNISKGDSARFEPFTENKGDYTEHFHNKDYEVAKVVKALKKTWNSGHFKAVEIYLITSK